MTTPLPTSLPSSSTPLDAIESAKRAAAIRAVADHFPINPSYIGIGSGSTIVYVVDAIRSLPPHYNLTHTLFVPTGYQSRQVLYAAGLRDIKFDSLPRDTLIDVAFDGADEVDEELNCIKGGGACLYQEKLVATHARKFVCVADHRKLQARLLSKWPSVPVEVEPLAANTVLAQLERLGSKGPRLREGQMAKAGPIKTDQDNFIVDAPFRRLLLAKDTKVREKEKVEDGDALVTGAGVGRRVSLGPGAEGTIGVDGGNIDGEGREWEVEALAREIKMIEGVLSVGLFCGLNGEEVLAQGAR
ncbi:ribose-5-phosphate isomerase [Physcia stellaris]|nr:ribose-5-phosphate isomerase [Physcia stellaris]